MKTKRLMVSDVMSSPAVTVDEFTGVKEIACLLRGRGFNAVPVVSRLGRLLGVVSEADIIARQDRRLKQTHWYDTRQERAAHARACGSCARDIMTPTPATASAATSIEDLAETMWSRHLKSMPVVDDEGDLVGMVSRRDLMGVLDREDDEIAGDVWDCLADALVDISDLEVRVKDGVVTLVGEVGQTSDARRLAKLAADVDGVVRVWPWIISRELGGLGPH